MSRETAEAIIGLIAVTVSWLMFSTACKQERAIQNERD